jgi:organic radical activating enzyme
VVITGGEPLRQNIAPLLSLLYAHGYRVQLETAGTIWQESLDPFGPTVRGRQVSIVCSPKTGNVHPRIAAHCRDWKYIIRHGEVDEGDGLPNVSTQVPGQQQRLYRPTSGTIWVQPCEEYTGEPPVRDDVRSTRNVQLACALAMRHGYRLSLQVHKHAGLP